MAHFAEIDGNNTVISVLVVDNELEHRGEDYLANELGLGGRWLQTSYNTHGGVHSLGGNPLRKNYAGIGYSYDPERDAFIPRRPYESWNLDEETCLWEAPVAMPTDVACRWNEELQVWEASDTWL
jgi:glyoxylase-like metal-dependent hydrolase (beta-lactamase superfamily II)